jgi:hypothetical protein
LHDKARRSPIRRRNREASPANDFQATIKSVSASKTATPTHPPRKASLSAGRPTLIRITDAYRNGPVFIRRSMHVPPSREAVRDAMPVLFEMLAEETEPSVRVVLGHFIFVYIHPYMDGNGRIGRFLMNVMLAAGGYPWTVVPVERRVAIWPPWRRRPCGRTLSLSPTSSGSSCVMAWREESSPTFRRPEAKAPGAGDGHDISGCLHRIPASPSGRSATRKPPLGARTDVRRVSKAASASFGLPSLCCQRRT